MIRIIAVEREFGCGGGTIASKLAEHLGWKLWDQQLTDEIARIANVECSEVQRRDEKVDPLLYRLGKVFWRGSHEGAVLLPDRTIFDADRMVQLVQHVMDGAASEGNCVIVGRGAPWFLRGRADTFSVFLYAGATEKLRRLRARGRDVEEAEELLNTVDAERAAFIKHYFGKDWPTRCLYHAMLNTAVGDELVITAITSMMENLDGVGEKKDKGRREMGKGGNERGSEAQI
jgi:cytidylate kinase